MTFTYGKDHLEPAFSDRSVPQITWGLRFDEATAYHITNTLHCSRFYIIASNSLSKNTDALKRLQSSLGDKVVGLRVGMTPHTHWNQVLEIAQDAGSKNPDCIVTLGAGSLTDGAKVICWMLANEITTSEGMEKLPARGKEIVQRSHGLSCRYSDESLGRRVSEHRGRDARRRESCQSPLRAADEKPKPCRPGPGIDNHDAGKDLVEHRHSSGGSLC